MATEVINKILGKIRLLFEIFSSVTISHPKLNFRTYPQRIRNINPKKTRILYIPLFSFCKASKPKAARTEREKSIIDMSLVGCAVDKKGIFKMKGILAITVGKEKI